VTSSLLQRRRLLAVAILVLAVALRLWDLNARSLWFDEAGEFWVSTAPFSHLIESVRTGTGDPPLYEFLLHAWMSVSSNESWLRLLSVLASVSGVAAVMVLAEMLTGAAAVSWCAGLLLAILPADIRYAQEVGQYGLVPAAVAWNLVCLMWMTRAKSWRALFTWVLTALAASYLYYATIFPVAAAFACVVFESVWHRDARLRRTTGTALVLYVIGMMPLLITYLPTQLARVVEGEVAQASSGGSGIVSVVRGVWRSMCELFAFQFTGWPHTHLPPVLVLVPVLALIVMAIRRSPRLVVWLAVAVSSYALVHALGVFPMGYRWGLILTPLIICAIAAGAAQPGRLRWATFAALMIIAGAGIYSLPNRSWHDRVYADPTGAWPETEDMRAVANYWLEHRSSGEPTYVYYGAAPAFAYYTRDTLRRDGLPSTWCLSCWHDVEPPAYCRDAGVYYGRWMRRFDTHQKLASVVETLGGAPPSLWLVFGHMVPGDDRDLIAGFKREGYRVTDYIEGVNASACLVTRTP